MRLKFGMVGGGNKGFIGDVHRRGALWDGLAELVAGSFSRNYDRNLEAAEEWHVQDKSRVYKDYKEMAREESKRDDGIDFVVIVTPNNTHYEIAKEFLNNNIHVVCDKPLTITVEEAEELVALSKSKDLLFGVTYTYTGYPMIMQAHEMVKNGDIGDIVYISGEFSESWMAHALATGKSEQATWRMEPEQSGKCGSIADLGTHVEAVISKITGLEIESVLARFNHIPKDLPLENHSQVLAKFDGGIPGEICTSQVAIGREVGIVVKIFGTKGTIEWNYSNPNLLKVSDISGTSKFYSASNENIYGSAKEKFRLPAGAFEGFYEAFANIYREFCSALIKKKEGLDYTINYPTVLDGLRGMKFIEACFKSNQEGNVWVDV